MYTHSLQQKLGALIVLSSLTLAVAGMMPATTHAAVTDTQISEQKTVVRTEARETIEAYVRLVLYAIIQKLETRVNA